MISLPVVPRVKSLLMNLAGSIPSTTAKAASSEHHQGSSFGDLGLDRQVHAVRDNNANLSEM